MNPTHDPLTDRITDAMHRSVRTARAIHKALGLPMVIWKDGRVQFVDPETSQPVPWPTSVREGEPPRLPPQS